MTENEIALLKMRTRIFTKSCIAHTICLLTLAAIFFVFDRGISKNADSAFAELRAEVMDSADAKISILPVRPYAENPTTAEFFAAQKK